MAGRTYNTKGLDREKARQLAAARRKKRAKRRKIIFFSFLFLFTIALLATLSLTVLFKIEHIEIANDSAHSDEEILSLCGVAEGENLILARTASGRENILESFSDVDAVTVDKRFPSTVAITVQAAVPTWCVEKDGSYVIISARNRVLDIESEPQEGLILVRGIELESLPEKGTFVQLHSTLLGELSAALTEHGLDGIVSFDVSDAENLRINYANRLQIELGDDSQLNYKIQFAAYFVKEQFGEEESGTLDATEPGKIKFVPSKYTEGKVEGGVNTGETSEGDGTSEQPEDTQSSSSSETTSSGTDEGSSSSNG